MKNSDPSKKLTPFDKLLRNGVFTPAYCVGGLAIAIVATYFQWFKGNLQYPLSKDPAVWGQFGDFIGGVLNPICAYMAFIWLVRSYALQKTELAETRKALDASQKAQEEHAKTALLATKLNALNIKLTALTSVVTFEFSEITRLQALSQNVSMTVMHKGQPRPIGHLITEKQKIISDVNAEQNLLLGRIDAIEKALS